MSIRKVEKLKHKYGIEDNSIQTMDDLKEYVNNGNKALKNFNDIHKEEIETERRLNWITGKLDIINQEAVEFILMQISQMMDPEKAKDTAKYIIKTSVKHNVPIGLSLTFLDYENMLQDPIKSNISSTITILDKYFWNKNLHTLKEIATGVGGDGKKLAGGYTSELSRIETGRSKVNEDSNFKDIRPYGYNEDKRLEQNLLDSYNKLTGVLTNSQN